MNFQFLEKILGLTYSLFGFDPIVKSVRLGLMDA